MRDDVFKKENVVANDMKSATTMERMMGVEPTLSAWEAGVLPMNYIRVSVYAVYHALTENSSAKGRLSAYGRAGRTT